jgi:tRNA(Ile)-lysidine synthase TilS/MesJ
MTKQEKELEKLVSEKKLEVAFGNSNFGDITKREVIKSTLLKYACGYYSGYTAKCIVKELGLITEKLSLTKKGKEYLYYSFADLND